MKKMESFEINYKNKNYNNSIANKLGKFLFYKQIKKQSKSNIFSKFKVIRKIQ